MKKPKNADKKHERPAHGKKDMPHKDLGKVKGGMLPLQEGVLPNELIPPIKRK